MALSIRLSRGGSKKRPYYRKKRDGVNKKAPAFADKPD